MLSVFELLFLLSGIAIISYFGFCIQDAVNAMDIHGKIFCSFFALILCIYICIHI